jgi:hypothetical protein
MVGFIRPVQYPVHHTGFSDSLLHVAFWENVFGTCVARGGDLSICRLGVLSDRGVSGGMLLVRVGLFEGRLRSCGDERFGWS